MHWMINTLSCLVTYVDFFETLPLSENGILEISSHSSSDMHKAFLKTFTYYNKAYLYFLIFLFLVEMGYSLGYKISDFPEFEWCIR